VQPQLDPIRVIAIVGAMGAVLIERDAVGDFRWDRVDADVESEFCHRREQLGMETSIGASAI
jgi:hypothetical protein